MGRLDNLKSKTKATKKGDLPTRRIITPGHSIYPIYFGKFGFRRGENETNILKYLTLVKKLTIEKAVIALNDGSYKNLLPKDDVNKKEQERRNGWKPKKKKVKAIEENEK